MRVHSGWAGPERRRALQFIRAPASSELGALCFRGLVGSGVRGWLDSRSAHLNRNMFLNGNKQYAHLNEHTRSSAPAFGRVAVVGGYMGGWEKDYITSIARTTGGVSVRFEMMKAARNNIGRSPSGPLARV